MNKKTRNIATYSLVAIITISFSFYFFSLSKANAQNKAPSPKENVLASANALEAEKAKAAVKLKAPEEDAKFDKLESQIKAYIGTNDKKFGLYYYDLASGKTIEINSSKEFTAGSTVKVPMNMVLLDMVNKGKISLNETMKYNRITDCEAGTGILQGQDLSKPIAIKTLSEYSIVYSDNIATNMILRKIGFGYMRDCFDKMLGHKATRTNNVTTALNSGTYLKLLYRNPNKNPYYSELIENMKKTEFHDRIDKYIPQSITAHKIGDYGAYVNDIAIVYAKRPYILVVLTNELPDASEKIAHISKMVYEYQTGLK
jgi:beta-lactamase class A